mgnify:CR=1 FL=1
MYLKPRAVVVCQTFLTAVAAAPKQGRLFPYSNHNPDFFVDLPAVTLGAQVNTVAALALLGSKP